MSSRLPKIPHVVVLPLIPPLMANQLVSVVFLLRRLLEYNENIRLTLYSNPARRVPSSNKQPGGLKHLHSNHLLISSPNPNRLKHIFNWVCLLYPHPPSSLFFRLPMVHDLLSLQP